MDSFYNKKISWDNWFELSRLVKNNEDLIEVSNYLKENGLAIEINNEGFEPSMGNPYSVILEDVNLSGNGYCYSSENLMNHIRTFREYQKIRVTEEYQLYLRLKEKYKHIPE